MENLDLKLPSMEDIQNLLRLDSKEGRIWMGEERMILLRSSEMRALRKELIETLGMDRAKGLLIRMGYVAGLQDAHTAARLRPDASPFDAFSVGPQAHMITGQTKVRPIKMSLDADSGDFHGIFEWENSFEVEVFLSEYGVSFEPVCWSQIGYASGFTSGFMGRRILFREQSCAGCGESHCLIEGRPIEQWNDAEDLLRYYEPDNIADRLFELQSQVTCLRETLSEEESFGDLVGCSPKFLRVRELLAKAAESRVTVLLLGETGVGKDMFAKALHKGSPRASEPFVAVNCAAISRDLMEAELFGVEKGAFTGADQSRPGRFERAHGGTLFLDEVGELSPQAQAALLRVLQEGELERVGDTQTRSVDVRLVAATNEDLSLAVAEGRFRADLLYRLNVYSVTVPPLRERIDDLAELVPHLIDKYGALHGKTVRGTSSRAMEMLRSYEWPGNIRELSNVIERGIILARPGADIEVPDLFPNLGEGDGEDGLDGPVDQVLEKGIGLPEWEEAMIDRALALSDGNVSAAAKRLKISRATLDYRLKKREQESPDNS